MKDHTFIFSDLVGFTALTEANGDEHAAELALDFYERVRTMLPDHCAEEVKTIGDAVMLRCDDAEPAVRLGLRLVSGLEAVPGFPPVRVGMHTGPAVSRDGDWYGATVNVAARLCAAAGGGEVLVGESTLKAAGRMRKVQVADRRLHWLKNVTEPIPGPARQRASVPAGAVVPATPPAGCQASGVVMSALPPGPTMPRLLQSVGWIARPLPWLERCRARYGDVFTLRIAQEGSWVLLAHPDDVKQVFTGDPEVLHAGEANIVLRPVLGPNSVLLLDDAEHMAQRRLMLPSFHGERMQRYEELMTAVAEEEISRWPSGQPFALWPRMQAVTLEVIMRAVFGVREADRLAELRARLERMLDWTTQMRRMVTMAVLGPERVEAAGLFRRALAPVDEMLIEEIRRRRLVDDLEERDDVLSLLVQARYEDGRPMSDAELRDELITLLVAGHETTATSLSWAIERLVRHPDKWDRLREEAFSAEDDYADAVARETLRLRPVLPIVVRRLTQPLEIGGWALPAGAHVAPCIHLVHRRPDVYPEPHAFRPERFLEQPAGTYTWIPFGGGVRRCLGATFALFEMKTVLRVIAREAALRPASPEREPVARRVITLTPGRGAEVVRDGGRPVRSAESRPVEAAA